MESHSKFAVEKSMMNASVVAIVKHKFKPLKITSLAMISVEERVLDFFLTPISLHVPVAYRLEKPMYPSFPCDL